MSDQFVAEIRIFGFNFAPTGWAECNGQIMPISQNTALFSLLGTNYGGNGTSNFGLPNLQGNIPMGAGNGAGLTPYVQGETGGVSVVTLDTTQIPSHSHTPQCSTGVADQTSPAGNAPGSPPAQRGQNFYATSLGTPPNPQFNPIVLSVAGGNQPHNNMPPYLAVNFCIALNGIFPPRG